MIKRCFKYTILFLGLLPLLGTAQQINKEFVEGEIYVKLKEQISKRKTVKRSANVNVSREIPNIKRVVNNQKDKIKKAKSPFYFSKSNGLKNTYRIKVGKNESLDEIIKALKEDPTIEYVERVPIRQIIAIPSDTAFSNQWFLNKIKAPEAWDVNAGINDVVVAVVDNAIQVNHVDLVANMLPGRDVSDNDNDPSPPNVNFSHGTHVAGIVAAVTNNITGIASAGNNRVKVLPIKATSDASSANFIDNGFEGIAWAVANGADIISLSWGGSGFSQTEQDIINDAYANGVLVIAAAGNANSNALHYPSAYDHVISVASLDDDDSRSSFSSFGSSVDISAPGRGIYSTIPFDDYASYNGTSMATPLIASCAGYLLSCFPGLSPDSLESVLKITSDKIETQNPNYLGELGSGRVNLLKAIACKDANLFSESPSIIDSYYICSGDSTLMRINQISSETFEWQINNVTVGTSSFFYGKEEGSYILKRTIGDCELISEPLKIIHNKAKTAMPSVNEIDAFYCDSLNKFLVATAQVCNSFGPNTYQYTGPEVGFDGYEKSGAFPTVEVNDIGGLIDSVTVSITWQKKDGDSKNTCSAPDGGRTPFNEEISFQLISPEGLTIDLLTEGTYFRGSVTSGIVTTIFTANGSLVPASSLPANGSFKAAGDLGQLSNKVPQGTWTLVAQDNYLIDPLCVSGFSITIKTKEPTAPTSIEWYDASDLSNSVGTNDSLIISTANLGLSSYYTIAQCEGLCPSETVEAKVNIHSVPELFAFSKSAVLLSNTQIQEVMSAQSASSSVANNNIYSVTGINALGNPFNYQISNNAPNSSPISLCEDEDFMVFGTGCNGTISWSNGSTGVGVLITNQKLPYSLSATCNQDWKCAALVNVPFVFEAKTASLVLDGFMIESSKQNFYGGSIESVQILAPITEIRYKAASSIILKPGFEANQQAIFSAEIGNCSN